jgi:hypothetical protein
MTDYTPKLKQLLDSSDEDHWRLAFHLVHQQGYNEALATAMTNHSAKRALCLEYGFGWLIIDRISGNETLENLLKANQGRQLPGWGRGYDMLEELHRKKKALLRKQDKWIAYAQRKAEAEANNEPFDEEWLELRTGGEDIVRLEAEELSAVSEHIDLIETRLIEVLSTKE